jgi:hypothetical protein
MTARDLFLTGRRWTRVEVHIYEQNDARGHVDKELGTEHGSSKPTPAQPVTYETFETRAYVLTHIPSKSANPCKESDRANWSFHFEEDDEQPEQRDEHAA